MDQRAMGGARRTGDDVRRGRPAARRDVRALLALQRRYDAATRRLFAAVDAGDLDVARRVEHEDVDPVFGVLEDGVARATRTATSSGLRYSTELKTVRGNVLVHSAFAFAFGIGLLAGVLNKPVTLTAAEYALMQRHAVLGCDIVRAADMPDEARWVRHHHERYDGGGYPARSSRSPSCAATRAPSSTPRSSTHCAVCSTAAAPPAPPRAAEPAAA
jgi:hypothetical protein